MLRFRGFRASLNLNSWKTNGIEQLDKCPGISLNGAYRINRDELFGSDLYPDTPRRTNPNLANVHTNQSVRDSKKLSKSTSDITKQSTAPINQSKSTSNLFKQSKQPNNISKSENSLEQPSNTAKNTKKKAPEIPKEVNRQTTNINVKEQKKLEKQRLAEQKKQEKNAEKERKREEKLKKEREKLIVQQTKAAQQRRDVTSKHKQKKEEKNKAKKRAAPQPQQISQTTPSVSQKRHEYSTNTLESSMSKSSGPPPYSSAPEVAQSQSDSTGNISLAKPVEAMDSWGLISQHRQQMNRQAGVGKSDKKQRHLDLNFNAGSQSKENRNSNA